MHVGKLTSKLQMCKDVIAAIKMKIKEVYKVETDDDVDKVFNQFQQNHRICYEAWG